MACRLAIICRQAIIWTIAEILLIGPLGANFSEISSDIHIFSFKKHLEMSSVNWQPSCRGLNVLIKSDTAYSIENDDSDTVGNDNRKVWPNANIFYCRHYHIFAGNESRLVLVKCINVVADFSLSLIFHGWYDGLLQFPVWEHLHFAKLVFNSIAYTWWVLSGVERG